ncbi:TadE-like protein [Shewanella psychrophila]|uniref:TadE-like protein n=1 Tax=Shewanella psychrophila TaxID=225848 RepID=A0A1S6HPK0_9GAMM|nr:TadE family protein [Shewanella psychrophila]AQS37434.1 TadE-like protein [Shewanella psychrophila]
MRSRQEGSQTLEFTLTLIPFFILLLMVVELCRFMLTANLLDAALSTAARQVVKVNDKQDILLLLRQEIEAQDWPLFESGRMKLEGRYFKDFEALVLNEFDSDYNSQMYGEYRLTYAYQMLFIEGMGDGSAINKFERTVLVAHENR